MAINLAQSFNKAPSINSNSSASALTKTNEKVNVGGKNYDVYKKGLDSYVIYDTGISSALSKINTNKYGLRSIKVGNKEIPVTAYKNDTVYTDNKQSQTQTQTQSQNSGGVDYNAIYNAAYNAIASQYQEPEKPKKYTSKEVADLLGIKYDYDQMLADYNKATEDAYNGMIEEQNVARAVYANNVLRDIDNTVSNYLSTYKNAAPTASGRATIGANALSTMLGGYYTNNQNDYGLLQSINNLEEQRKAELKDNVNTAREHYNKLGLSLGNIGANYNTAETDKYKSDVEALATNYAADRSYAAALAEASRNKYSALATAAGSNAASTYQGLYNYYKSIGQTNKQAAANVNSVINNTTNSSAYLGK